MAKQPLKTQQFKSVSIRTIVNCALHGKPINANFAQLYDLQDTDIDDEREILSDYDDELDIIQAVRDNNAAKLLALEEQKRKEVSNDGTPQKTDETPQTLPTE